MNNLRRNALISSMVRRNTIISPQGNERLGGTVNNSSRQAWAQALTGADTVERVIASATKPGSNKLPEMHVGRAQRHGNIDWFPIWTNQPVTARRYKTNIDRVQAAELADATVAGLSIRNDDDLPLLLLEGTLLEGGWQHRALTRTVFVPAKSETNIPVVCVERSRWGGVSDQQLGTKQAPARVRSAIRGLHKNASGLTTQGFADQGIVWSQVSAYQTTLGKHKPTESLVDLQNDLLEDQLSNVTAPVALPGQRGVVVAIRGQVLAVELFDHPDTLTERLPIILDGYLADAYMSEYIPTRSQSVRNFIERIERLGVEVTEIPGRLRNKADKSVASEAVSDAGEILHLATLNASHEFMLAV
jgi:hypothetical protein